MGELSSWYTQLLFWFQKNAFLIAAAQVATIMVLYGDLLNKFGYTMVKKFNIAIRILSFFFICVVGHGLVAAVLTNNYHILLKKLSKEHLMMFTVFSFAIIGFIAERRQKKNASQ